MRGVRFVCAVFLVLGEVRFLWSVRVLCEMIVFVLRGVHCVAGCSFLFLLDVRSVCGMLVVCRMFLFV